MPSGGGLSGFKTWALAGAPSLMMFAPDSGSGSTENTLVTHSGSGPPANSKLTSASPMLMGSG